MDGVSTLLSRGTGFRRSAGRTEAARTRNLTAPFLLKRQALVWKNIGASNDLEHGRLATRSCNAVRRAPSRHLIADCTALPTQTDDRNARCPGRACCHRRCSGDCIRSQRRQCSLQEPSLSPWLRHPTERRRAERSPRQHSHALDHTPVHVLREGHFALNL